MPKIKLYIATSLDGFIARNDGSLDWLVDHPNPEKLDYGYHEFYSQIDVVVMGRTTYDEIISFDVEWPYNDCTSFVVTSDHSYSAKSENTHIIHEVNEDNLKFIKEKSTKNIWIVGGGKLISTFLNHNAIDDFTLYIMPTIIGSGIPLFTNAKETRFDLVKSEYFDTGVAMLSYSKK